MKLNKVELAAQAKMAPTIAKIGTEPVYVLPQIGILVGGKNHLIKTGMWLERAGLVSAGKVNYWRKPEDTEENTDTAEPAPEPMWKTAYDWLDGQQAWQVMVHEFVRRMPDKVAMAICPPSHEMAVKNALLAGMDIGPEILMDYPDLAKPEAPAPEPLDPVTQDVIEYGDGSIEEKIEFLEEASGINEPPTIEVPILGTFTLFERAGKWGYWRFSARHGELYDSEEEALKARAGIIAALPSEEPPETDEKLPSEPDLDAIAKRYVEAIRTEDPMVIKDIMENRLDGKAKARRKRLTAAGMLDAKLQPTDKAKALDTVLFQAKILAKDGNSVADVRLEPVAVKPTKFPERYDPKGIDDLDHTAREVAETFAGEERTRYALMATHVTKSLIEGTDGRMLIRIPGTPNDPTDRMMEKGTIEVTEGQFPDVDNYLAPMDKADLVATIDVAKEARRAQGMRPSPVLEDIDVSTVVKLVRPGRKHDVCLGLEYYQRIFKAAAKLGLKQLDIYSHAPTQAVLFAEHGADNGVKIVLMPLGDGEACHHYVVDFSAAEPQPQPEPKEEPVPIVDFHKAKATVAKPKPQPKRAPEAPAKVTTIAEARQQVEAEPEDEPEPAELPQGHITDAELAEIKALTARIMQGA